MGMSGQLLNSVLSHYNLGRNEILLTNAASCHYPEDMKELPQEAIECCRPRLMDDLARGQADALVLMGNSAVRALTPDSEPLKGITKLRAGPPKKWILDGTSHTSTIIPTFHPAACLRNQAQFPLMVDDIGKAVATDKPAYWYEPSIQVIDDPEDAIRYLELIDSIGDSRGLVVDTESGRDKDTSYGRDDGPYGRVLCIGIGTLDEQYGDTVFVFTDKALTPPGHKRELARIFNAHGIIAQNGKYDIGVLMNYLEQDHPFPLTFDTMLASYCMNENGGIHGLKYMGPEWLSTPNWDDEIKPFITKDLGYASIPQDMLHKYNAFDVHVTRLLYGFFHPFLEERGLTELHQFLLEASYMLTEVETRGLGFDMKISKKLEEYYTGEIEKIDSILPLNPRSSKQVIEFFGKEGIELGSSDEDHLRALLEMHESRVSASSKTVIKGILASRGVSKLRGTYVTGLQKKYTARGTIHPSFLIHGTNTGRLSSRGPNSQNIPRSGEIKKQFIPSDPSRVMIQNDYSQAELRYLTFASKEENLRAIFNDPERDVFTEICRQMFPNYDNESPDQQKELRTLIKTFAYGVSFGRTAEGIAGDADFHMDVATATDHMDNFKAQIPALVAWQQENVIDRIHAGKDLINPYGRHKRVWLLTDMNKDAVERECLAFPSQSTASDMCLTAAIRANREGIHIVNLIHDAILHEAPPDEAEQQALRVHELMVESAQEIVGDYVRFNTDWKIGKNWHEVR